MTPATRKYAAKKISTRKFTPELEVSDSEPQSPIPVPSRSQNSRRQATTSSARATPTTPKTTARSYRTPKLFQDGFDEAYDTPIRTKTALVRRGNQRAGNSSCSPTTQWPSDDDDDGWLTDNKTNNTKAPSRTQSARRQPKNSEIATTPAIRTRKSIRSTQTVIPKSRTPRLASRTNRDPMYYFSGFEEPDGSPSRAPKKIKMEAVTTDPKPREDGQASKMRKKKLELLDDIDDAELAGTPMCSSTPYEFCENVKVLPTSFPDVHHGDVVLSPVRLTGHPTPQMTKEEKERHSTSRLNNKILSQWFPDYTTSDEEKEWQKDCEKTHSSLLFDKSESRKSSSDQSIHSILDYLPDSDKKDDPPAGPRRSCRVTESHTPQLSDLNSSSDDGVTDKEDRDFEEDSIRKTKKEVENKKRIQANIMKRKEAKARKMEELAAKKAVAEARKEEQKKRRRTRELLKENEMAARRYQRKEELAENARKKMEDKRRKDREREIRREMKELEMQRRSNNRIERARKMEVDKFHQNRHANWRQKLQDMHRKSNSADRFTTSTLFRKRHSKRMRCSLSQDRDFVPASSQPKRRSHSVPRIFGSSHLEPKFEVKATAHRAIYLEQFSETIRNGKTRWGVIAKFLKKSSETTKTTTRFWDKIKDPYFEIRLQRLRHYEDQQWGSRPCPDFGLSISPAEMCLKLNEDWTASKQEELREFSDPEVFEKVPYDEVVYVADQFEFLSLRDVPIMMGKPADREINQGLKYLIQKFHMLIDMWKAQEKGRHLPRVCHYFKFYVRHELGGIGNLDESKFKYKFIRDMLFFLPVHLGDLRDFICLPRAETVDLSRQLIHVLLNDMPLLFTELYEADIYALYRLELSALRLELPLQPMRDWLPFWRPSDNIGVFENAHKRELQQPHSLSKKLHLPRIDKRDFQRVVRRRHHSFSEFQDDAAIVKKIEEVDFRIGPYHHMDLSHLDFAGQEF
uniref:Uncharacterized protein n=1 Tax=Caenorhabditis japonica TaxID=281687 RepID=A0A8R1E031_CAEJA